MTNPTLPARARRRFRHRLVVAATTLLVAGLASAQGAAPASPVEVQAGDTFSGIAARYTGNVRTWRKLYDARLSRLPNPNRIEPGMQFELVSQGNKRYLRLMGEAAVAGARAAPAAAAAPATAPAAAPTLAPAPPPAAMAAMAPGVTASPAPAPKPADATPVPDTLVLGVLPNVGAAALMAQYESMKHYLERLNPQKVRVVLPANFKAFFEALNRGDYDLAVAAPHFARVAQADQRMVPLALYEPRIGAQLIVPADSPIASAADLRGKSLAFANPQSLVAMYGRKWLAQQNLEEGRDFAIKAVNTDVGVGRMMLTGEVAAAIMSTGEFRALAPEESSRLKILEIFARIPNFVLLGKPQLGTERLEKLKAQLLAFPADAEDGAAFSKATGFTSIVNADEAQLRELDPFVAPTRKAMAPN